MKAVEALNKKGFTAVYCADSGKAVDYILKESGEAVTIGFGGSMSVTGLQLGDKLKEMGKQLLNHGVADLSQEERLEIMRRQLNCDLFLTGTNALTLTGCLVNTDGAGNRVAAMIFGPRKVIVVAGRNKLVSDTEGALHRIKDYAAPPNAKRLKCNTPCAVTGFCADCSSPDRICRITSVIEYKPRFTDIHVLVVNEDLGF
jgi:hypothetical protein